jgi:hypothetical protein
MPHTRLHRSVLILILAACAGCKDYSAAISAQFNASGKESVDLQSAVPSKWDNVCILGPYTDNAAASKTLGFAWPVESRSNIGDSDGISLLVFLSGKSVIEHVEHPRSSGDFANLSGRCFAPSDARFRRVKGLPDNWPEFIPSNEA